MAMTFGGTSMPTNIENHGEGYLFKRPDVLFEDGEGNAVVAPYASITWTFDVMEPADYTWWRTTLLAGARSVKYSSAQLYDDTRTLTSYTNAVVYAPTYSKISNNWYHDVVIEIKYIK